MPWTGMNREVTGAVFDSVPPAEADLLGILPRTVTRAARTLGPGTEERPAQHAGELLRRNGGR